MAAGVDGAWAQLLDNSASLRVSHRPAADPPWMKQGGFPRRIMARKGPVFLLVPHRLRRPARHETRGMSMVASPSATGTEVGCSMVRESPSVSRTRNAGAPRNAPWAGNGSGARLLEFF